MQNRTGSTGRRPSSSAMRMSGSVMVATSWPASSSTRASFSGSRRITAAAWAIVSSGSTRRRAMSAGIGSVAPRPFGARFRHGPRAASNPARATPRLPRAALSASGGRDGATAPIAGALPP